ncbi:serine/threonine-protein kinase [Nannocystis sp. SCPEA4]|uniref:serine/threonine-protein kinase n=1 Tax=Nannocystis sp. SCPEA4 TaxID=2996787 RepID=UPI002270F1B3|nr:protein kinase [Nannocystis sp. SCPEA4]
MVEADYTGVLLDGRYRVEARLGQGGMGTVYVAEHVGLAQPRAIKFLRADLARKPGAVQRFLQEARVLSAMRHDNLVGVIDMGEHAGSAYYVMELLAGEDLRQRLRRLGGFSWPQTRAIALQVCAALRVTHARGVVHRDLKPENCFCVDAADGAVHIKLIDFGVAKVPREAGGASQLTGAGEMLGTIGYMAPEQLEGQGDRRADVYSLGAVMFEMLAGRPLHTGNAYEILARMLLAPAPALASVCAVDPAIDRMLATAVARDPDERFASMDAFAAAIAEIPVTAEPQAFVRPASALARPAGETTAGGTPRPADMPVTAVPGPEDILLSSPRREHVHVLADSSSAADAPALADTLPGPPVPADRSFAPPAPVPADSSTATNASRAPVPADSSAAPSRSRVARGLAVALLAAGIAWQVWPVDEVSTPPTPAPSPPATAATGPVPAASPIAGTPVPAASLDTPPVPPAPTASPDTPPDAPVPAASPDTPAPAASRPAPVKPPRDAAKPAASARPLTREALRGRLERELASCGSPYVAEEIAVRVTPGNGGKLAGLAAIADGQLAPGTVACIERELARVLAGLAEGVDAARAFDVSLTLPRRGGG